MGPKITRRYTGFASGCNNVAIEAWSSLRQQRHEIVQRLRGLEPYHAMRIAVTVSEVCTVYEHGYVNSSTRTRRYFKR